VVHLPFGEPSPSLRAAKGAKLDLYLPMLQMMAFSYHGTSSTLGSVCTTKPTIALHTVGCGNLDPKFYERFSFREHDIDLTRRLVGRLLKYIINLTFLQHHTFLGNANSLGNSRLLLHVAHCVFAHVNESIAKSIVDQTSKWTCSIIDIYHGKGTSVLQLIYL
jgi:hypothetical protein